MSEKGSKILFDKKFNIIKQREIVTKKVTSILSYTNNSTGLEPTQRIFHSKLPVNSPFSSQLHTLREI